MENTISPDDLQAFAAALRREEKSAGTVEKYVRDAARFSRDMGSGEVTKERVSAWREALLAGGLAGTTVNSMLAAVNALLRFLGREECCVRALRLQRRSFRDENRNLTMEEYGRLLKAASGKPRLYLLLETICSTGIRVSEVRYITVEAASAGKTSIALKGKIRTILLPGKLCRRLLEYARQNGIDSGEIFLTRGGKPLDRRQIWEEMKGLCGKAGVEKTKVFPHNLRHLFAHAFYRETKDIVELADVLGHSSIETTRIYLVSTGEEHARILDKLRLVR